jgi:3-methyl-2-oxobutanoate hydroxymethyltransferase
VAAVRRGAPQKFIIGDMPFLAHRGSLDQSLAAVAMIMRAGAQAVKIEGIEGSEETFAHIIESGVPIMGHLGLTPQSYHKFGGFKVQATDDQASEWLLAQAKKLESAGCFAVVLECVPAKVAKHVSQHLKIPTIGIGAGPDVDGQVLVFQDMMGFNHDFKPKFVRRYLQGFEMLQTAFNEFDSDVKSAKFPLENESY